MRYKFRAWHKTAREMLYEDYYGDVFKWLKEGQPIEIMQCTGLRDKNGKEIYEGDIVKTRTGNLIVEWGDDIACFECVSDCSARGLYRYITDGGVEIIGNIHEKEKPV